MAAPATPQPKTATNSKSSPTLITAATVIAINGDLLFPSALKIAAKIL